MSKVADSGLTLVLSSATGHGVSQGWHYAAIFGVVVSAVAAGATLAAVFYAIFSDKRRRREAEIKRPILALKHEPRLRAALASPRWPEVSNTYRSQLVKRVPGLDSFSMVEIASLACSRITAANSSGARSKISEREAVQIDHFDVEGREVSYDHLYGDRFRHATSFKRWWRDRESASCTYGQLDTPLPTELAVIFGI